MGQYIYENHMGGLYCSECYLDYDFLYCEACGDSDMLLGYAQNIQEAWDMLKEQTSTFNDSFCKNCIHEDDYEYCDNNCEDFQHSGGYDLGYIMKFLIENFEAKNVHYVYLAAKHCEDNKYVFVNVKPDGYKFGEKHSLPYGVSIDEKFVSMIARSLCTILDGPVKDFKEAHTVKKNGNTYHIFTCIEEKDEEFYNKNWRESASYKDSSWYGYMEKDKIALIDELADFIDYL